MTDGFDIAELLRNLLDEASDAGDRAEQWVKIVEDHIPDWAKENLVKIFLEVLRMRRDRKQNPHSNIDIDWYMQWRRRAKEVSHEDMQQLWAQILVGEFESPGSYSLHALDLLGRMSRQEAQWFERLTSLCLNDEFVFLPIDNGMDSLAKYQIDSTILRRLDNLGLIHLGSMQEEAGDLLRWGGLPESQARPVSLIRSTHSMNLRWPQVKGYSLSNIRLTWLGKELCRMMRKDINSQYLGDLVQNLEENGVAVKTTQI